MFIFLHPQANIGEDYTEGAQIEPSRLWNVPLRQGTVEGSL